MFEVFFLLYFSHSSDKMLNRVNLQKNLFGLGFEEAYSRLREEDMVLEGKGS